MEAERVAAAAAAENFRRVREHIATLPMRSSVRISSPPAGWKSDTDVSSRARFFFSMSQSLHLCSSVWCWGNSRASFFFKKRRRFIRRSFRTAAHRLYIFPLWAGEQCLSPPIYMHVQQQQHIMRAVAFPPLSEKRERELASLSLPHLDFGYKVVNEKARWYWCRCARR